MRLDLHCRTEKALEDAGITLKVVAVWLRKRGPAIWAFVVHRFFEQYLHLVITQCHLHIIPPL